MLIFASALGVTRACAIAPSELSLVVLDPRLLATTLTIIMSTMIAIIIGSTIPRGLDRLFQPRRINYELERSFGIIASRVA
jgi:hypothetical protein